MKTLIFSCFLILLASCHHHKMSAESMEAGPINLPSDDLMTKATVKVNSTGCVLYLEAEENGEKVSMYPVNLDDKLKIDGLVIRFTYHPSKAMQPENCLVDKVVALDSVVQL